MRRSPYLLFAAAAVFLIAAGSRARAWDGLSSFVMAFPFQANEATPIWLGHPETPPAPFATLLVPVIPPDASASLLVTVFFQEKEGGFLRVTWGGTQGAQVLTSNFYEGIAMTNRRSLLISPETLAGGGTLKFVASGSTLGIQRIKLEWLETKDALISPEVRDLLVTPASGATQPAPTLDGHLKAADPAEWHDRFIAVPITDLPQRIEQGVEFSVELDSVPASARLTLQEAGLPLDQRLVVWINQQRAGTIAPAVPDLTDDGFDDEASRTYVGWRDGSLYIPISFLKVGVNTVQLSTEPEATASAAETTTPLPLAVKSMILQLKFPSLPVSDSSDPPQLRLGPPPSQDVSTSTGPVAPASPSPTEITTP